MEKSRRGQCGGTRDAPEVTAGRQAGSALGLGLGLAVKACLQRWESCLCSPPCLVPINEAWSAKQQQSSALLAPWRVSSPSAAKVPMAVGTYSTWATFAAGK